MIKIKEKNNNKLVYMCFLIFDLWNLSKREPSNHPRSAITIIISPRVHILPPAGHHMLVDFIHSCYRYYYHHYCYRVYLKVHEHNGVFLILLWNQNLYVNTSFTPSFDSNTIDHVKTLNIFKRITRIFYHFQH